MPSSPALVMGLEIRGSSQPGGLPCRKVGEEDFGHSQSLLCWLWDAEGRSEGSRNIQADPRRRSTQKSLSVLVWHAFNTSLVPGGWMQLPLAFSHLEKPCMVRVASQGFCDRRNWALHWSFVALCVQDTWKGVVLSWAWWCQAQYLTSPHTLVPKLVFVLQKTAWPHSSCATTKVMLVGGRKQMQGIYFPVHQGTASAFGLDLMFKFLTDFFSDAWVTAVFSYEIITSLLGCILAVTTAFSILKGGIKLMGIALDAMSAIDRKVEAA